MRKPEAKVPQITPQERALQQAQADLLAEQATILRQQQQQQQALMPFFAQQAGLTLQYDEEGNITGATEVEDPLDEQRREIEKLLLERSEAALRGELPVDPALESELAAREETLRERLQSQFGPGYETSTPGIETLEEFERSAASLRSGARTGQLTLAEQLSMAREGMGLNRTASRTGTINAGFGQGVTLAQAFGGAAGAAGAAQQPFQFHRGLQTSANQFNANLAMQNQAGWGALAGTMFGAGFSPDRPFWLPGGA